MPFEDISDDNEEQTNPGDEALDELAGTLSGETIPESASESTAIDDTTEESDEEATTEIAVYDPQSDPAFPTAKTQTQHSIYCLPETWENVDGSSGLLFEAEITLRRDGYDAVQKRELHNAILRAAAESLTADDIAEAFVNTREDRTNGTLLEEDS
ncbi:hypothetical protein HAPAU_34850 [Halalkalicoccus paucihalophilus]|uniref:Uncharacterized protein n=1 Tax=Halalkalicoccus paucihalophilus TaxID=1008153 RepID=A0A151AAI4_9EURY|nr:hypothetical protein [Halalkalicoccus paucihalophilus]KYH24502.1 hypothetical protein HAPAU_34850 [Halalkalicoccus paucihalophilus]